jgi:hypothetical protein
VALFWVSDWFSVGVVVVAELFLAETWADAAVAVGEDVAAYCFGVSVGCCMCSPHTGYFLCKVFGRDEMSPDFGFFSSLFKCEGPAFWPGLFLSTPILSK